ncbi:MAG: alpha/beta fold hydrolase [Candidatus Hodarchaeales archaeon]|jgi:pimeloyl-ACP methyl ester carboxylesterase
MNLTFEFIETNGIKLHTAFSGSQNGEPVFLLHGFPDAWFGWEEQIASLAFGGYRVIIPDQRGYNLSDKPQGSSNYRMELLMNDLLGLADKLDLEQFFLVGHDFGAMVAWWTAIYHPERIKRMIIANVPHPKVMRDTLKKSLRQLRKSWYTLFFRIPRLPERMIRLRNWKLISSAMAKGLEEDQLNRYREAWSQPDAMRSMINWYRAFGKKFSRKAASLKVSVPTLILWGKQDPHLSYKMAPLSEQMCLNGHLETFEEASHWVHQDEPERFNLHMIEFFQ